MIFGMFGHEKMSVVEQKFSGCKTTLVRLSKYPLSSFKELDVFEDRHYNCSYALAKWRGRN